MFTWVGLLINYLKKKRKKSEWNGLLRAPYSMGRRNLMRVDEGGKGRIFLAEKKKARTVVLGREKSLLCDHVSELRPWREKVKI